MNSQTVTVIIAAYNAQSTIARAIRSALEQPEATEIIVVDDASTDSTITEAKSADDGSARLKILSQLVNYGPSSARNRAIAESTSSWVALLDADDVFLPGRIGQMLAYADSADFIADDVAQVDEHDMNGARTGLLGTSFTAPRTINFTEFVLSNVTRKGRERGEMGFLKPLIRRDFLIEQGLHYNENMRLGEDYELYARALAAKARFIIAPFQGYLAVTRSNSLSAAHSEADLLHLRDCDMALLADFALTPAEHNVLMQHYRSIDCRLQWRLLITAVKSRRLLAALATFLRPWPVPIYLVKQLGTEARRRIRGKWCTRSDSNARPSDS